MRPRPEGRGEHQISVRPCQDGSGRRFNAATTRRPWRTSSRRLVTVHAAPRASMRPRPEGRGERELMSSHVGGPVKLQCGHDPKAVENQPRTAVGFGVRQELRCGHGQKAVEKRLGQFHEGEAHAGCFNAATTRRPWRTIGPASTAPAQRALQCGHDPKAVENSSGEDERNEADGLEASMRPRPEGRGDG